jgi:CheY-like chemotaxis protein
MKGKRILVVEDDNVFAGVIRHVLTSAGCEVFVATSGSAAWELLHRESYDMVVSDHHMPGLSGSQLFKLIRDDKALHDMPIILITAKGLELDLQSLRAELGVCAVFNKPFSPRELCRTIDNYFAEAAAK